jgi:tetratricopeptide (TPR) repeat protein
MRRSQAHSPCLPQLLFLFAASRWRLESDCLRCILFCLVVVSLSRAQDTGTAATEFFGRGAAVTVIVHDPSGQPIASPAVVKLSRSGSFAAAQAETNQGRAELVANEIGDYNVVVEAPGYATVQKDIVIGANGRAEVDVYLRVLSANSGGVPGRPLLAPKARKEVDEGLQALGTDNLAEAQKHAVQAMRLAPGHPDVFYLQGVIFLKQRDWSEAQKVLEQATSVDPSDAKAFAALGMALCDQGKYEAAVAPLEKALQLDSAASSWDTRWALAKAYYQQAHYDQALQMSQSALSSSNGKAPEIELLVAQSLTAVGRYEDAAQALREFVRDHSDRREAATARRWLERLAASGKIHAN